jgi:hypothetical protein
MFDLSGTTVYDDTGVRDCLYKAAQEFNLKTTPDESEEKKLILKILKRFRIQRPMTWQKRFLIGIRRS